MIPKPLFNRITPLKPLKTEYRDVNDNRIKFEGKTTAIVEIDGEWNDLEILVTTKKTNPLLGSDWMKKLGITLDTGKTTGHRSTSKPLHRRSGHNQSKTKIQKTLP